MKKYGIIGYPLSHSFSQRFFTEKFNNEHIEDTVYEVYPMEDLKDFDKLLQENTDICGLNVTIPHKVNIIAKMDWCSAVAHEVGAVNCVRVSTESPVTTVFSGEVGIVNERGFLLEGFNTDAYGFENSLSPLLKEHHKKAMVLGDGGAAQAVKYVLRKLNIPYQVVTRKPGEDRLLFKDITAHHIDEYKLIINTTPLGTSPDVDSYPPIPYEHIGPDHLLYDLVYNPEVTAFLQKGLDKGAAIKNGYEMLVLQAEKSWELWHSKTIDQ